MATTASADTLSRDSFQRARWWLAAVLAVAGLWPLVSSARDSATPVTVTDPYLELHTGPGRGYPVTQVVPRGEVIEIQKRHTDWYLVRDDHRHEGWVHHRQLVSTLQGELPAAEQAPANRPSTPASSRSPTAERAAPPAPTFTDPGYLDDDSEHRLEAGVATGRNGAAHVIRISGAYLFNDSLSADLAFSQVMGNSANKATALLGVTHHIHPEWRVSPYVSLGVGAVYLRPKTRALEPGERISQTGYVGVGLQTAFARRFMLRADYRSFMAFAGPSVGFAFFF
jgi:uncharacterized protein YraI